MQKRDGRLIYSPSDLIAFLDNEQVTWLDRYNLEFPGQLERDAAGEDEQMIRSAGDAHEARILESFVMDGRDVANLRGATEPNRVTAVALGDGREIIYQPRLESEPFAGFADFLVRVPGQSALGPFVYEVWDTKLARNLKPYYVVQLCCYAEMVAEIQGCLADRVVVVLGNGDRARLRTSDYLHYYRAIKADFLAQQNSFDPCQMPVFNGMADYRHWSGHVTRVLEARDDLSLVANIRASQVEKLQSAGITSMRALADSPLQTVSRVSEELFSRLRAQAQLQLRSAGRACPEYEVILPGDDAPRTGLATLPPASPQDVFFDIEGYPLVDGGLEYLLGVSYFEAGQPVFQDWWAHDRAQERRSFESFVRWVHRRWQNDPAMHIYHYAAYETAALKRLMSRYGCCEQEVDDLLHNRVFVDLFAVVRQGLRVGEPAYSLKNIEHLYMPERQGEVATAGDSMVHYHTWREDPDGQHPSTSAKLKRIRDYNEQDCVSTGKLAEWLRRVQSETGIQYLPPPTEDHKPNEVSHRRAQLAASMLERIPAERAENGERWRVHELLAHLLEFHRRENKPSWWRIFDQSTKTEQELIDDPECLGGLVPSGRLPQPVKHCYRYEYRFDPEQESKLRAGDKCCCAHDIDLNIEIETIDYSKGLLTFRWRKDRRPPERFSLIPKDVVSGETIAASIETLVREYLDGAELPPALKDYLFRRKPRLRGRVDGSPVIPHGSDLLSGCVDAALRMDNTVLCVQGPPGSGKTYSGGRMIAALLKAGKRVGITSHSHRAICLLLQEAAEAADVLGVRFRGLKAGGEEADVPRHPSIEHVPENGDVFEGELPDLVGGTAWVFSKPKAREAFDYLFIDEAGQVCVANLVGMSPSAHNLVLLGDQMQLNQPLQGCHPGESGSSALEYLLQHRATVPGEMGIFLDKTWRLRPEICSFISGGIYEGRLQPEPATSQRWIRFGDSQRRWVTQDAGLLYVPVEHADNTYESDEEVDAIGGIVSELQRQYVHTPESGERRIALGDILVVSPYNLQVRKLAAHLPGLRVGTVDKFQGQQAPVVIVSMTSSEGDASPRGIEFLFSKNRLNVAISRAQILVIVVASPKLARTRCARLEQIALVNLFCRAVESGLQAQDAGSSRIHTSVAGL